MTAARLVATITVMVASALQADRASAAPTPDAEREFRRGLSALHEFEYEDANDAFRNAQKLDHGMAMAYWGEAMSYHQSLWNRENLDAARAVLGRLGATPAARASSGRTPKEADLLAAAEVLFGAGSVQSRRRAYADAMGRLHDRYSDDPDIAAFYALSLLATMTRGLIGGSDAHEGHSSDLAGSEIQSRVGALLEAVLRSNPDHRGALHYLLHDYDDPDHASRALSAARRYARIASASHARHMPAHIFLQLGLWGEAAESDRAAYDASVEWTASRGLSAAVRNYHALSWLEYELLQLGRYRDAEQSLRTLEPLAKGDNTILLSDFSSMRARYVVETERWELMAGANSFANVNDLFAVGLSMAHLGRTSDADRVRTLLAQRAQAKEEGDLRPAIVIMERELAAAIAIAAGRTDEGVATLLAAARAELDLPLPVGLPQPIKPAPEMLGELLTKAGRFTEAIEWFERGLQRNPNRSRSILGLARAATAAGRTDVARQRYGELAATLAHADAGLPELAEARAAIQTPVVPVPVPAPNLVTSRVLLLLSSIAATVVAVVFIRRRFAPAQKERPAPMKGAGPKASTKRKRQKR